MQYLIDVLRVVYNNGRVESHQEWHSTHDTLDEANGVVDTLRNDPLIHEIVLLSWQAGNVEPKARVVHGNGSRCVAGGVSSQAILVHLSRPIIREVWANSPLSLSGYVFGEWSSVDSSVGIKPTTQPAPGYKLKPELNLGRPIHIVHGLRAESTDADVVGSVVAMIRGYGWRCFDKVYPCGQYG